jgi:hypothetical protein
VGEFFQSCYLGISHHCFPKPLRSRVFKGNLPLNGKSKCNDKIRDVGVVSHAIYPDVFDGLVHETRV